MGLKNRLGTAVYEFDGDHIKLQSNFENIESLTQETGVDFYDFLNDCDTISKIVTLFYHLQIDSEYTKQQIHGAFFSDLNVFLDPEVQEKMADATCILMGVDKQKLIQPAKGGSKKKDLP